MHILVTIAAVSIFALGIYFNQIFNRNKDLSEKIEKKVLSELSTEENKNSPTPAITSQKVEMNISGTPPTPTSPPTLSSNSIEKYIYPDAKVTQSFLNNVRLTTTDDPTIVTKWYRNKIIESGMSVRSFVTTSANEAILNKLSGADSENEVIVEIKKDVGESRVFISVSLEP